MMQPISFKSTSSVFNFWHQLRKYQISKTLKFEQQSETVILDVEGLIYHEYFYFTSHIIGSHGIEW